MKPEILPMIRDSGRLLMLDIEETSLSVRKRERRLRQRKRAGGMSHVVWPNAKWWRYIPVSNFSELPSSKNPQRDLCVIGAWNRLGSFERWDEASAADLILILIETPFVESTVIPSFPDTSGSPADVRPWLQDRNQLASILMSIAPLWGKAVQFLLESHRIEKTIATRLKRCAPGLEFCTDPYAFIHFRQRIDIRSPQWQQTEVRSSLALLRGRSIRQAQQAIYVVEEMFNVDESFVAPIQRFLLSSPLSSAARWLLLATALRNPVHRRQFLERLSQANARMTHPPKRVAGLLQVIAKRARIHGRAHLELDGLFEILEQKGELWVLQDMLQLSGEITPLDLRPSLPSAVRFRPELNVLIKLRRLLVRLDENPRQRRPHSGSQLTMDLWKRALHTKELCRLVKKRPWEDFDANLSASWVHSYLLLDDIACTGVEFRSLHHWLYRLIQNTEIDHRRVKLEAIIVFLDRMNRNPSFLLRQTIDQVSRTVAEGFDSCPHSAVNLLLDFYHYGNLNHRWSLGNVSRSAFKNMAEATRNYIATERLEEGISSFLKALPEVDLEILFRQPRQFLRILRELGSLAREDQNYVTGFIANHPAFSIDPLRVNLREACEFFDSILTKEHRNPIPAKLRASACGRNSLRPEMRDHYRSEFATNLAALRLSIVRQEMDRRLHRYQENNLDPHTVRFLNHLGKSNRRAFKRFYEALREGNTDYRDQHPANRLWLKQHKNLQLEGWVNRNTNPFPVNAPELEGSCIRLEDNPQEELKMGSYVGSCLSVGGCNQHSAVANTLDINKRIAFLRNRKGQILARQLLAISEEGDLVPFDVYMVPSPINYPVLEEAFRRYDRHLASILNLPLRKPDGGYTIRTLLAKDWYDDYAWDIAPEPNATTRDGNRATNRDRAELLA